MEHSNNIDNKKIVSEFFKLLNSSEESLVITNKHKKDSRLAKNNLVYTLLVKKNEIEYIKDKDHFKNKMKYIINSDTLLYRNNPIDADGKLYFFEILTKILKEIKKNNTWIVKNKG